MENTRIAEQALLSHAKLLIVDDEAANVMMLEDMLSESGYHEIHGTRNPQEVVDLQRNWSPDLILLDLMMPELDGFGVMAALRAANDGKIPVPVLVLTADISPQTKRLALRSGARDFLTKPFDAVELLLRISSLLEIRFLHRDLQQQNLTLEDRVHERTVELEEAQSRIVRYAHDLEAAHIETLERLALAGEFRDDDTGQHTLRVSKLAGLLAEGLGLDAETVRWIQQAARLHDVGKIGISDLILLKPGRLTPEEFDIMKRHTTIGAQLFEDAQTELIQLARRIALGHHERWDGTGYPNRLRGEDIPLEARLLSVADVFDALTHHRPYKAAWSVPDAVAEIAKQSGTQFDPAIVEIFLRLPHETLI